MELLGLQEGCFIHRPEDNTSRVHRRFILEQSGALRTALRGRHELIATEVSTKAFGLQLS